jgi:Tfp pilus assembly protein PilF
MTNNTYISRSFIILIRNTVCVFVFFMGSQIALGQNLADIQLANEYILKGEKKKALEIYRELAKAEINVPIIHNNFFNVLLDDGLFDEAQSYLKKNLRRDPDNIQYKLDLGIIYVRSGDLSKAERHFKDLISENKASIQRIKMISDYLSSRSLTEYSIQALTTSRNYLGNPFLFCLDLAMLYRMQGKQDKMVEEYLNYVTQSTANIQYVKNVLQALLTKPEELESLEQLLYQKVQEEPDAEVYPDLLVWVTVQQKNFTASFTQARAYDKRYKTNGDKCMEVARVALDNDDFDNAAKMYRYVIREYQNTDNYLLARLGLIRTHEARVRKTYPVNIDSVKTLVASYENFVKSYPENNNSLEAARNEASLYANYLDQKDIAIEILNKLVANPRASLYLKSKAKLDLGDIYLTKGEPWESTLLYSQVEKTQKENPIAYEAKLRNARLSYYKGDFRLAQEHLDILKEATTREIANDAMDLSMLIKENIAFDSVGEALKEYASIELLLYQNKTDEALRRIGLLKQGFAERTSTMANLDSANIKQTAIYNQTILDDAYWLEAKIRMQRGEFTTSITLLQKILDEFESDVLSDDAYFLQAEIYEKHLKNKEKAMEIYREFLNKFPGSVYAAEARKRYRILRGDFNGQDPLN